MTEGQQNPRPLTELEEEVAAMFATAREQVRDDRANRAELIHKNHALEILNALEDILATVIAPDAPKPQCDAVAGPADRRYGYTLGSRCSAPAGHSAYRNGSGHLYSDVTE